MTRVCEWCDQPIARGDRAERLTNAAARRREEARYGAGAAAMVSAAGLAISTALGGRPPREVDWHFHDACLTELGETIGRRLDYAR